MPHQRTLLLFSGNRDTKGHATMTPIEILREAAKTFAQRNRVYRNNYKLIGPVMQALHPQGVTLHTADDHVVFQLWSMVLAKLSRFAVSGLTHLDSIHDLAVYAAMLESVLRERHRQRPRRGSRRRSGGR